MKTTPVVIAILFAIVPGVASAQTADERSEAAIRAIDYCISVARSELADAGPVDGGPMDFVAHRRNYGALQWQFGANGNGKPEVVVSPGELCMVMVQPGPDLDRPLAAWMRTQSDFQPRNAEGTAFFAASPGGWVTVGWGEVGPIEGGEAAPVMVVVQAVKGSN